MSHPSLVYPPSRYDRDAGQVNARLRRSDSDPDVRYKNGGTADYLATGESTNGRFGLYRWNMSAVRSGPDPHFHRTLSESFFMLSGTIKLFDGKTWIDAQPGDFLFVPEGGIHGFRNESGSDASMLILFAPGAPREDYFETLARVSFVESMSDDERTAFMLRHDTFWV
jgi:mannose-6-phosphate isomerase-like protein (cupin superfamily)